MHIENIDQKINLFLMKLRLDFLFRDLSHDQHFRMYLMVFAIKFFIHAHGHG